MRVFGSWSRCSLVFCFLTLFLSGVAGAANVNWIGGDNDWVEGAGNDANWSPADEPDADDTAIFNTADTVNLGSNNNISGLTMSGGIDLSTNNFDLPVDGLVQLTGASTNLFIGGAASELNADDVTINSGSRVELTGGTLVVDDEGLAAVGFLAVNAGGTLAGNGTIQIADGSLVVSSLLNNNGTLTALSRPSSILSPPPVRTLTVNVLGANARIDLDGSGEAGIVNVNRNQTLDVNGTLADAFNGDMNMFHETTLNMSGAWSLGAGGTINIDNGEVVGIPGVAKGTSTIAGGGLTQSGGTINVVDSDGTLQFEALFTMNGGAFNNNGHTIFNRDATIAAAATFTMGATGSDLTVGPDAEVTITQNSFNLDGGVAGESVITVNEGGSLTLNLGDYDNDTATNAFDGVINLNSGGFLDANVADPRFVMNGTANLNGALGGTTLWGGSWVDIGNDLGSHDAHLNITAGNLSSVEIGTTFNFKSDADVHIAAGADLRFRTTVNFDTVNGANNAKFTGTGIITFNGDVNVNEAVTLDMTGGTVDLDGNDLHGGLINVDAPLVINAQTMSSFGRMNISGVNTLDINHNVGTGSLTVNLDDNGASWTLNEGGVMNLVNDNAAAVLLAGDDVNLNGTVNVTGDVHLAAQVHIGPNATININTAGEQLRFMVSGNTISGGTITGPGRLATGSGFDLQGFGTIDNDILFEGQSSLRAKGGTLTLNGDILAVVGFGTADATGILNVVNPWDSGNAGGVGNRGGIIQGGTITNNAAGGIGGFGTVTARVINNTSLSAGSFEGDEVLLVQTAGNDNDWDGAGAGRLEAFEGDTLELRDVGPAFGFTGTVHAEVEARVFTNGFALDFNPGSTISLEDGSTYESTNSTDIGGTVTVLAGNSSTIKVQNNSFLTFETGSSTTLNADLQLENNNIIIEAGATFSGGGALVIPEGSNMLARNAAEIDVVLEIDGSFRPGNTDDVARVEVLDYQQSNTGKLYIDLTGNGLSDFDRLVADGTAVIDGFVEIDLDDGFEPELGDTFPIITAPTRLGQFDFYDIENINEMPDGLAFRINYLANAVQLEVVLKEFFAADFDEDGDVDQTDYGIWKNAFGLNQLGDANGDNISDASDYTVWRNQLGSVSGGGAGAGFALEQVAVPEPGTWVLMTFLAIPLAWTRRKCS